MDDLICFFVNYGYDTVFFVCAPYCVCAKYQCAFRRKHRTSSAAAHKIRMRNAPSPCGPVNICALGATLLSHDGRFGVCVQTLVSVCVVYGV